MKLAVLFPGIGYHMDKPLLYHSRRLLEQLGWEVRGVDYGELPKNVKGDPQKMRRAFELALSRVRAQLPAELAGAEQVVFVSKSLGTAVAAALAAGLDKPVGQILFTPVAETFTLPIREGIVFHGTADSWADTAAITAACAAQSLPLYTLPGADHSLEAGDAVEDLKALADVMARCRRWLESRC